ncbi:MAG TPA: hypothetical protein PK299_03380 [Anaerolineales bacterium]|nr:hypothetical protein [Anaerolineales bacterium]
MNFLLKRPVIVLFALSAFSLALSACGSATTQPSNPNLTPMSAEIYTVQSENGASLQTEPSLLQAGFALSLRAISLTDAVSPVATSANNENDSADQATTAIANQEAARQALPSGYTLLGKAYAVESAGASPVQFKLTLPVEGIDASAPIRNFDLFAWDGVHWQFVPSQLNNGQLTAELNRLPSVLAILQKSPATPSLHADLLPEEVLNGMGSGLTSLSPAGLYLQTDGTLQGVLAGGFDSAMGYAIQPLVEAKADNNGRTALDSVLANPQARQTNLGGLVDLANNAQYNGIKLDYRGISPERSTAFTVFVTDLANELHKAGKQLTLVIPAPVQSANGWNMQGYNLRLLGQVADALEIDLQAVSVGAQDTNLQSMLSWMVGEVNREKLRILTSAAPLDVTEAASTRLPTKRAMEVFGQVNTSNDPALIIPGTPVSLNLNGTVNSLEIDAATQAVRYQYTDGNGVQHLVYIPSTATLQQQLQLAQQFNLNGTVVRNLFDNGNSPAMFNTLINSASGGSANPPSQSQLVWQVSKDGATVTQEVGTWGQPFSWTPTDAGTYQIAAVLDTGEPRQLSTYDMVVNAQLPPTPAPAIVVAGAPAVSGPQPTRDPSLPAPTNAPVIAPVPAVRGTNLSGGFEMGGQVVHGGIPAAAQMKQAGFTWVKVQTGPGANIQDIANAHNMGFKILLSVVGDRNRPMDPSYQDEFAAGVAAQAAAGADAIEVWNEPNLTREWPDGQINPANYVPLLQKAYNAIKAANPNTIVISGAPAPTGYWGACTPSGCDDRYWMEGLLAAGGANYMDCIGAHYNEGLVSPYAYGGNADPRDNHYTRYFYGMVETYVGALAGTRKICFTELGYLSGQEWGSVPGHFMWKPPFNNTVAEQAQYLAEAAAIGLSDGRVRLIIVFNVDFTFWGDDPQAGYAMIRPDGSCPACVTIGNVLGSR